MIPGEKHYPAPREAGGLRLRAMIQSQIPDRCMGLHAKGHAIVCKIISLSSSAALSLLRTTNSQEKGIFLMSDCNAFETCAAN